MAKILVYRWKAYNYIDVMSTFAKLGYEIDEISQPLMNYDVDEEFGEMLRDKIRSTVYDFVFSINYFGIISDICQEQGVLYVAWSCDSPMISMHHESVYNSCNRIFVFDRSNCLEFETYGVENVYYLPLAVNVDRINTLLSTADEVNSASFYENDISFVGSLYERNNYDEIYENLPEYLRGYFDGVIEAALQTGENGLHERMLTPDVLNELESYFDFVQSSQRSFSNLELVFANNTLGFKIAREERIRNLIEISKRYKVGLYTGSDTDELIRVENRGPVDYWKEMPRVFANSKINLNMTIPNIKTGIPLRVWDIMGAGGFVLTNHQLELDMYFEDGKDLVTYSNNHDMLEKIKFYLENDSLRNEIAARGADKVRKYHTYDERIKYMLQILKDCK